MTVQLPNFLCKLTTKIVAAEMSLVILTFRLKQYLTNISPVIPSVETFLPAIVVILWIQTIEQNIAVKAELIDPHGLP